MSANYDYLFDPDHEMRLHNHFANLQHVAAGFRITAGSAYDLVEDIEAAKKKMVKTAKMVKVTQLRKVK